jgi:hypothetical protein
MSMYSELLSELCADMDPVQLPGSRDELVVILLQCRRRLDGHGLDQGHVLAEDLALELDHDRMLIRLCAAMGIESDPTRFVNPLAERSRLDTLLRQRGVDFRTLDDNRRRARVTTAAEAGGLPGDRVRAG